MPGAARGGGQAGGGMMGSFDRGLARVLLETCRYTYGAAFHTAEEVAAGHKGNYTALVSDFSAAPFPGPA